MCYEQLLIWPVAWSFLSSTPPTLMIGVSNHGWSGPGAIEPRLQADAAAALAHLFGVPLVAASNTPAPLSYDGWVPNSAQGLGG